MKGFLPGLLRKAPIAPWKILSQPGQWGIGAVTGSAGLTCVEVTQRSESSQPTQLLPTPPNLVTGHHNTAAQIPTSPPSCLPTEKLRKASYWPLPHFCLQILPQCTKLAEFSSHPSCKGVLEMKFVTFQPLDRDENGS